VAGRSTHSELRNPIAVRLVLLMARRKVKVNIACRSSSYQRTITGYSLLYHIPLSPRYIS
jgi:hypothetical protein